MSYLVLARKYRPMFFQDVVGQQHVTTTLQNAIQQNRVANAYLFSGPRGVGKTTVARILSKALNCQQGPSIHPCNKCSSCQEINESQSLDVFEIDGASNRGIDEVRNLRESLRYSPNPGKHRIYIIDEVHMLTNEAFNALLKTLEEPPSRVLFIFATTEVHKVPATILSRCQRFEFKRITNRQLMGQLRVLCSKEDIQIDEESLRLIVSKADGSMRDSQSILDQVIAYGGKTITSTDVVSLLGIINFEFFFKMTQYIQADDVQCGLDLANTIFIEGYDYNEFLIGLQEHFRNFLVVKNTRATTDLDVSEEHAKRYLAECDAFEVEDLLRLIKIAADTENLIRRSSNARLHLEMALVKMIKLNKSVQLSDLLQQLDDKKKSLTSQHHHPKNSYQTRYSQSPRLKEEHDAQGPNDLAQTGVIVNGKASEPSVTLQQVEQQWPKIIQEVKRHKVLIGSFLDQGWPTALHGVVLEISFDKHNGFHIEAILNNANFIQQIIRDILGVHLKIKCSKDEHDVLKQLRKTPAPVDRKKDLAEFERQNPMLRIIKETFDADWVD